MTGTEISVGIIIQARTGSTRFPNKVVKAFHRERSLLYLVGQTALACSGVNGIVIATTDLDEDDVIAESAGNMGVGCYRGSSSDVLQRFIHAAEESCFTHVIRICADNPFVEKDYIQALITEGRSDPGIDYISFQLQGNKPAMLSHIGLFAEWVRVEALKRVVTMTHEPLYHEHVTNFIYQNPDETFRVRFMDAPDVVFRRSDIRLTCDTAEDFDYLAELFHLKESAGVSTTEGLVELIDKHPGLVNEMQAQIQRNEK